VSASVHPIALRRTAVTLATRGQNWYMPTVWDARVGRVTTLIAKLFGRPDKSPGGSLSAEATLRDRVNRMLKNRLSDRVDDVFQQAMIAGDLDTAEDLLSIMENMHERRRSAAGEARINDEALVRARLELSVRKDARRAAPLAAPDAS
jgi:hypothetical protein